MRVVVFFIVLALAAMPAQAKIANIGGWESGNNDDVSQTGVYQVECPRRSGNWAGAVDYSGGGNPGILKYTHVGTPTISGGPSSICDTGRLEVLATSFYFLWTVLPSSTDTVIFSQSTVVGTTGLVLRIDSDGKLVVYRGTTELGTGATVLAASTWYQVSLAWNNTDAWSLEIDGAAELSGTETFLANRCTVQLGHSILYEPSQTVSFFYDDWTVSDTPDHAAPGITWALDANAEGSYSEWLGSPGQPDSLKWILVADANGAPSNDRFRTQVYADETLGVYGQYGDEIFSVNVADVVGVVPAGSTVASLRGSYTVICNDESGGGFHTCGFLFGGYDGTSYWTLTSNYNVSSSIGAWRTASWSGVGAGIALAALEVYQMTVQRTSQYVTYRVPRVTKMLMFVRFDGTPGVDGVPDVRLCGAGLPSATNVTRAYIQGE